MPKVNDADLEGTDLLKADLVPIREIEHLTGKKRADSSKFAVKAFRGREVNKLKKNPKALELVNALNEKNLPGGGGGA